MARTVGIGIQDFEQIIINDYFYIDKTGFIKEWWENGDAVTLIARPRRFGKTLTLNMMEYFFSVKYESSGNLFENLSIWQEEKYRKLQGSYPVIAVSFADVKETSFIQARKKMCRIIKSVYSQFRFLLDSDLLDESEKEDFRSVSVDMEENAAAYAFKMLSDFLYRYYGKKVIILLDEYDTPMQEAYVNGYWEELVQFIRGLFNATFKTNPYLERAIMTGITRVSKESIFSDLNNLKVVTTTSDEYADCFGFTEEEVFQSLDELGFSDKKQEVKTWYDGFTFGSKTDIYNPWSIINFLDTGKLGAYWANTSSNKLAGKLVREGSKAVKLDFEALFRGKTITVEIDEQIVYDQLDEEESAIWSLFLASGYLKVKRYEEFQTIDMMLIPRYELAFTNLEVKFMFRKIIKKWFSGSASNYNDFIKALLMGDIDAMNVYMNKVALKTFSYFDTGKNPSQEEPEKFYHGFVLGLMVELEDRYVITSNRESGFGRYDVMLEPRNKEDNAILLEFKVQDREEEKELTDTVKAALDQIETKNYAASLIEKGIPKERIQKYGFAFCGKKVLIDGR